MPQKYREKTVASERDLTKCGKKENPLKFDHAYAKCYLINLVLMKAGIPVPTQLRGDESSLNLFAVTGNSHLKSSRCFN